MALSANRTLSIANDTAATVVTYPVETGAIIYQHGLTFIKATGNRVNTNPLGSVTTLSFAGLAVECSTGSFPCTGNTAGTVTVDCYNNIDVLLPITGITDGNMLGSLTDVYGIGDEKGYDLSTLGPQIGRLVKFVSATQGWVRLGAGVLADQT